MNTVFSFKRFGMLFKKHTIENFRSYAISLVVFFGILLISLLISNYHSNAPHQETPYLLFLIAAGTVFTSNIFINLGDKRKTIATITLPATSFEKFLVGWVYSFLIFQVLYTVVYYALMIAILKFGNWPPDTKLMNIFSDKPPLYYIFSLFAILHAIVLYGAVAFKKMHFIKTAFALFIIIGITWVLNNQVLQLMLHHSISGNPPFMGASFRDDNQSFYNVDLDYNYINQMVVLLAVLTVIIWVAAYFRLKEKQV